jgi:hypothetical protein
MAELLLLSIEREWFIAQSRAAEKGDQDALARIQDLWSKWEDREIACFLCDATVTQRPPFMMVSPSYGSTNELIGCPLCSACQSLPAQLRWARCLKLWKRIWSERYKKNVTFQFNPRARQPHPH